MKWDNPNARNRCPVWNEVNPLPPGYHDKVKPTRTVSWTEPGLQITVLRLLSSPREIVWSVDFCHGKLGEEDVQVQLPFNELRYGKQSAASQILEYARRAGFYVKGTGIFDAISSRS